MKKEELAQLCGEITEFIDIDPRFHHVDEGSFIWSIERVTFKKLDDTVLFEVNGVIYETDRK